MGKLTIIQSSLNAGELSPDLAGHIDIDRYTNGAKTMLNAIPQIAGGSKRRPGTRAISPTKYADRTTRLIPFVFSKSQAYVLELGDNYARFYTVDGQIVSSPSVPIEIATPWPQSEVFNVEFAQGADTMFLANGNYPMKRLLRLSSSSWVIDDAPFDPLPLDEIGVRPQVTLALSSTTGTGTATATGAFKPADVGRNIIGPQGSAVITGFTDTSNVSYSVNSVFVGTSFAANTWKLDGSPIAPVTPSNKDPVDGGIVLVVDGPAIPIASVSLTGGTMTVTSVDPHGLSAGNTIVLSGFESAGLDGTYIIASVPTSTSLTFAFAGSLLAGGTLGTMYKYGAGDAWRSTDVGNYVSINGGLVEITAVTNGSRALGRIVSALTATVTAPGNSWSIKSFVWNATDGYPRAVSLYQQRLYAAGSSASPQTIWASGIGLYFDFTPGTTDSSAFSYIASSDQVNQIAHLASSRILTVLTQGEEFTVSGGTGAAVTPTNINVQSQSIFGCAQARPVRVANELIYPQRAGKKIRSMAYDFNTDSFRSQNLTRLASHVTGPGIIDLCFQAEPNPVVWMVRSDGVLVSLTYDRDDNVCGFARHTTDGVYKSVASIPGPDGDVVFAVVQRTVNGATVQYVEQMDQDVMTDAAILGTNDAGSATWTGLDYLEGKSVDVKGDGVYLGQFTVSGGSITLPRVAFAVEIGLHYESTITTLSPNLAGGITTSQANQCITGDVYIRVNETINMLVGDPEGNQRIPFRQFGENVLDKPVAPFTGDAEISKLGWDKKGELTLTQDQPYQWHVLAIIRHFTVNNG